VIEKREKKPKFMEFSGANNHYDKQIFDSALRQGHCSTDDASSTRERRTTQRPHRPDAGLRQGRESKDD